MFDYFPPGVGTNGPNYCNQRDNQNYRLPWGDRLKVVKKSHQ
jgi:hypothetical protein